MESSALQRSHRKPMAGLDSECLSSRSRGRRYIQPPSEISLGHEKEAREVTTARSLTPRAMRDSSGLTSLEHSVTRGNRGRKHINHGGTIALGVVDSSHASEAGVEASRSEDLSELAGGLSSSRWAVAKLSMGRGKKKCNESMFTHFHKSYSIADPGGPDTSIDATGKAKSFLGPGKRHPKNMLQHEINYVFEDNRPDLAEFHSKKHFLDPNEVVHCDDEYPLGHSHGPDLYTKGFLGKSKLHFQGEDQQSKILSNQNPVIDANDLSAYGLSHRGKKKHFKEHNLEWELMPKSTKDVADVSSVKFVNRQLHMKAPFHMQEPSDVESEPEPIDFKERHHFGDTKENQMFEVLKWCDVRKDGDRDSEDAEVEFRNHVGPQKRCFGNAHNLSEIMLDYGDAPGFPVEELTPSGLKWADGHGRRKIVVKDHLAEDGKVEDDAFFVGDLFGRGLHAPSKRHYKRDESGQLMITPRSASDAVKIVQGQDDSRPSGIPSGGSQHRGRRYVIQRDTRSTVQPDDGMFSYFSDEESTPRIIRTKSAPCFAMNPAPPSGKAIPMADRVKWRV